NTNDAKVDVTGFSTVTVGYNLFFNNTDANSANWTGITGNAITVQNAHTVTIDRNAILGQVSNQGNNEYAIYLNNIGDGSTPGQINIWRNIIDGKYAGSGGQPGLANGIRLRNGDSQAANVDIWNNYVGGMGDNGIQFENGIWNARIYQNYI